MKHKKLLRVIILQLIFVASIFTNSTVYADETEVYLGGIPLGLELQTQNVEIVGFCEVMTNQGLQCPASQNGLQIGDKIKKINQNTIISSQAVYDCLLDDLSSIKILIERKNEMISFEIPLVVDLISKRKKIGILIKDSISGIGTMTYATEHNEVAILGHPIVDKLNKPIEINGGQICHCDVYDVKKGRRGLPGELKGNIEHNIIKGYINDNKNEGVYGIIEHEAITTLPKIKINGIKDVMLGDASIVTTVKEQTKWYDISIIKVEQFNKSNHNFVIKIKDKNLIDVTGGIVQGMSGSPIVQKGRLIGAVTHVFVNDPTMGYGIGIENMLKS